MGAEGFMIASALHGILAQRLARRICESCTQATELTPQQRVWVARQAGSESIADAEFHEGVGCTYCNMTGYRGRIGIYELLEIDTPLADAIRRADVTLFGQLAQRQVGFVPLVKRALTYATQRVTSVAEVIRVTSGLEERDQVTGLLQDVIASEGRRQAAT
jgi:MSHA biogenesis protein MshE